MLSTVHVSEESYHRSRQLYMHFQIIPVRRNGISICETLLAAQGFYPAQGDSEVIIEFKRLYLHR